MKITKRDILAFILGLLTMIIINLFMDWNENVHDFKRGLNDAKNNVVDYIVE